MNCPDCPHLKAEHMPDDWRPREKCCIETTVRLGSDVRISIMSDQYFASREAIKTLNHPDGVNGIGTGNRAQRRAAARRERRKP